MVWLDSDDVADAVSEGTSNYTRAGADFYYGVALFEIGVTDQNESEARRFEKMLRE